MRPKTETSQRLSSMSLLPPVVPFPPQFRNSRGRGFRQHERCFLQAGAPVDQRRKSSAHRQGIIITGEEKVPADDRASNAWAGCESGGEVGQRIFRIVASGS